LFWFCQRAATSVNMISDLSLILYLGRGVFIVVFSFYVTMMCMSFFQRKLKYSCVKAWRVCKICHSFIWNSTRLETTQTYTNMESLR
jgi:hypothetical protein